MCIPAVGYEIPDSVKAEYPNDHPNKLVNYVFNMNIMRCEPDEEVEEVVVDLPSAHMMSDGEEEEEEGEEGEVEGEELEEGDTEGEMDGAVARKRDREEGEGVELGDTDTEGASTVRARAEGAVISGTDSGGEVGKAERTSYSKRGRDSEDGEVPFMSDDEDTLKVCNIWCTFLY